MNCYLTLMCTGTGNGTYCIVTTGTGIHRKPAYWPRPLEPKCCCLRTGNGKNIQMILPRYYTTNLHIDQPRAI
jgi:hypothetical protein